MLLAALATQERLTGRPSVLQLYSGQKMTQMERHLPGAQLFFNQLKGPVHSCPVCLIDQIYPVPALQFNQVL